MKPEVLQLIGSFHQGGSERQAVQLSRLLLESRRYGVHVACLTREGVLLSEVEKLGIGDVPEFPLTSFYDLNAGRQIRLLAKCLRERRIDIIHAHDFYTNVFGMAAASLARVPVRIASRRETGGMRSSAQNYVQRRAYGLAHAIVANSDAVRRHLMHEGVPKKKIAVIHNGLDTNRVTVLSASTRSEMLELTALPTGDERRYVTIVANMRHVVKDHKTFLRSAMLVSERVPDAAFVIAGEGELMESLKAFAVDLGLGDKTHFTGRCHHVAELLAASAVCVLSSTHEGFSNSILEYMAAARPVVATDAGGAREAIADGLTGYVVPCGDDGSMADRIVELLLDPVRAKEMGERGRLRVEQTYSCEAQLAHTEELYDRLLHPVPEMVNEAETEPKGHASVASER